MASCISCLQRLLKTVGKSWGAIVLAAAALALAGAPAVALAGRPGYCGHPDQRACDLWEYIPSCASGLIEWPPGHCSRGNVSTVVHKIIRSGKKLTDKELNQARSTATKVFKQAVSDTTKAYNQDKDALQKTFNTLKSDTQSPWIKGAKTQLGDYASDLKTLSYRMQHLSPPAKAAFYRTVRAIKKGKLDEQARHDLQTVVRALGLPTNQPGHLFANVSDPAAGIFMQLNGSYAKGASIGGNDRVAFITDLAPDSKGEYHYGAVNTIGGAVGAGTKNGPSLSGAVGIVFLPSSVAESGGGFVGLAGNVGVPGVAGVAIGMRWHVYAGMTGPKHAIPGFSLAFSRSVGNPVNAIKVSGTVAGGYGWVVGMSHSQPVASDWDYIYTIMSDGTLHYYRMDQGGSIGAQGTIGTGWGGMTFLTAGDHGELWVVDASGNLLFYKHDSNMDWLVEAEKVGYGGFNDSFGHGGLKQLLSAGNYHDSHGYLHRVLFAMDKSNTLWYYNFGTAPDGKIEDVTPKQVGWGWGECKQTFAGTDGVIYCIHANGDLYRYTYNLQEPMVGFPKGQLVSHGWNGYSHVFGGTNGQFFGVRNSDKALLVFHDKSYNGQEWTSNGQKIGTGFGDATKLTAMKNW